MLGCDDVRGGYQEFPDPNARHAWMHVTSQKNSLFVFAAWDFVWDLILRCYVWAQDTRSRVAAAGTRFMAIELGGLSN